jgi:hypothetical protein
MLCNKKNPEKLLKSFARNETYQKNNYHFCARGSFYRKKTERILTNEMFLQTNLRKLQRTLFCGGSCIARRVIISAIEASPILTGFSSSTTSSVGSWLKRDLQLVGWATALAGTNPSDLGGADSGLGAWSGLAGCATGRGGTPGPACWAWICCA